MEEMLKKKMNLMKMGMALLLVAVGVQSYSMYQMKGSMESMKTDMKRAAVAQTVEQERVPEQMMIPKRIQMPMIQVAMPTMMPEMDMMDPMPMSVFDERWSPVAEMMHMRKQMDRMFEDAFGRLGERFPDEVAMDMGLESMFKEEGDEYVMSMDMPNIDSENVQVSVDENNMMTVKGKMQQVFEQKDEEGNRVGESRNETMFARQMKLPGMVRPETMQSECKDGKLMIRVAKK